MGKITQRLFSVLFIWNIALVALLVNDLAVSLYSFNNVIVTSMSFCYHRYNYRHKLVEKLFIAIIIILIVIPTDLYVVLALLNSTRSHNQLIIVVCFI